ncbi:hypothetical protein ACFDR9_004363 [Janthinobacterium sp. CG_23.3]|uniref:hypothetical protein n=1 Tax=unclassified Janthinobacterium TaxID=2610881 RepID=UPI00034C75AC|nr:MULTISPECIES: hypothetical protein [unclassified Janthinobacterium]MEC5161963.1 hypothetical protein [Janthinobacterium sp. CG_S6]
MPADTAALPTAPACVRAPPLRGWPAWQARLVNAIKRAALRQLHASAAGERLLLRIYLIGEEATEIALQRELIGARPDWLARQMDQHLADEQRHAQAFAAALAERGAPHVPGEPDWLSRRKIGQWQRLARRHAGQFASGLLVPAFAIGLCAEQMASRVLQRHCALIGPRHRLHPLLSGVLADEERHVRLCSHTLARLVAPREQPALAALLHEIRGIDRAYGVTGALGMYLAGLALRLRPARA